MCTSGEHNGISTIGKTRVINLDNLLDIARFISGEEEVRRSAVGFIGYGSTKPGEKVLLAVDTHSDRDMVESISIALREKGAHVDVIVVDVGADREFDELDEIRAIIRRRPWREEPRRYEGIPWVEDLMETNKYDLLIHGKGGGPPPTPFRYECIPWVTKEHFASQATVFPRDLHVLINQKAWEMIYGKGKGGRIHLKDPEGTDLTWTLWEEYWDGSRKGFSAKPTWGHLMSHPVTPLINKEDATGVIAGTTGHFSSPFPYIKVHMDGSTIRKIEGGGKYGEAWRELREETKKVQYPGFPGPGLFWLWEMAIGTNVKIRRPANIDMLSSAGAEWERRRSGVIHVGIGTGWRTPAEVWAADQGIAYGHLHVHLLFPTMEIKYKNGEKTKIIDHGRLTVLDDPEVRKLASKYGDPDELLKEDWIPLIPGINAPGRYEEFAKNPAPYIYGKT